MSTRSKRSYDSTRRREGAEANRLRVLSAARMMFSRRGIDAVSIEEIAARAKLSAPTIYALFKSKAGILHALMEQALFSPSFRAEQEKLLSIDDPVAMLVQTAAISRAIYDSEAQAMGLMRGVSAFSPTLREQEAKFEKLRFDMQKVRLELLFARSLQRPGIDLVSARQILWMYTSRDIYRILVVDCKWPPDRYQSWLAETLVATLTRN